MVSLGFILVIFGIFCIIKMYSETNYKNYERVLFYAGGSLFAILAGIILMLRSLIYNIIAYCCQ